MIGFPGFWDEWSDSSKLHAWTETTGISRMSGDQSILYKVDIITIHFF